MWESGRDPSETTDEESENLERIQFNMSVHRTKRFMDMY